MRIAILRLVVPALLVICVFSIAATPAYAVISESFWKVNKLGEAPKELLAGETRHFEIPAPGAGKGEFTIEGELADGSILEIKCASMESFPAKNTGTISGGKPGIGTPGLRLGSCVLERPEKANCKLEVAAVTLRFTKMEIVEDELNGKIVLLFTNAAGGQVAFPRVVGANCMHRACPNMEGSVLAEVSPENDTEPEIKIKITDLVTDYVNSKKEKLEAIFRIEHHVSKLAGEFAIKPEVAAEEFGPFIK